MRFMIEVKSADMKTVMHMKFMSRNELERILHIEE